MRSVAITLVCTLVALAIFCSTQPITAGEDLLFYAAEDTAEWVGDDGPFQVWMGTGTGTHVGQYATLTYVKVKGNSGQAEGTTEIVANDGSVLYIEHASTWNYDKRCWEGEFQIVGGEGRFESATGYGDIYVCAPDYLEVLVGFISY